MKKFRFFLHHSSEDGRGDWSFDRCPYSNKDCCQPDVSLVFPYRVRQEKVKGLFHPSAKMQAIFTQLRRGILLMLTSIGEIWLASSSSTSFFLGNPIGAQRTSMPAIGPTDQPDLCIFYGKQNPIVEEPQASTKKIDRSYVLLLPLVRDQNIQRAWKRFVNLAKQDPGGARQIS